MTDTVAFRDTDGTQARDDQGQWSGGGGRISLGGNGDVEDAFTLHGTKYDATVTGVFRTGDNYYRVVSDLHDKQGFKVGTSMRVLDVDNKTVTHSQMHIDPDSQGKGIGAEYLRDSVSMYRRAGIERIEVEAVSGNASNGAYTWAKLGFSLAPSERDFIAKQLRKVGALSGSKSTLWKNRGETSTLDDNALTELRAFADRVATGAATIQDVADHPVGKQLLLGKHGNIGWSGFMDIRPRVRDYLPGGSLAASGEPVTADSIDYDEWEACELGLTDEALTASADELEIDDETLAAGRAIIRAAYAAAADLVAERILARYDTVTAAGAGDNEHIITDAEWKALTADVEDVLGDALLDGVVAGATEFGTLANPAAIAEGFLAAVTSFAEFIVQLRGKLTGWISDRVARVGPAAQTKVGIINDLMDSSPLSPDKADLFTDTELQAATNAGHFAALQVAAPAALRWVTMRDERVRPAHVRADTETVPYGETFTIDGYPARFPGDPNLPYKLRVNCRCTLAYVDGTEARRIVGATKAELRVKAAQLSIGGRSKMNKGQLQAAMLKGLCLQGMAGGPDCPDLFDQMNRTTLLALARGESITGRHRMNREQLRYHLRQTLRGGDIALVSRGYGTRADFAANRRLADRKRGYAPEAGEFSTSRMPPVALRRQLRGELYDEFAAKGRTVTCVHCGLRLGATPSAGLAMLVPEPILPWSQGGSVSLANLVPSCPSCFRARGGRGLTASAIWEFRDTDGTQPRDEAGQWSGGGGAYGQVTNGITKEMLGRAVDGAMRRRMERDVAGGTGHLAVALKRVANGQSISADDQLLVDIYKGDTKARTKMIRRLTKQYPEFVPSEDPKQLEKVNAAVKLLDDNPAMRAAIERFGPLEVVVVKSIGGAAASFKGNYIVVGPFATTGENLTRPFTTNSYSADESTTGALRHEYGHYVETSITEADKRTFTDAHSKWGYGNMGPEAVAKRTEAIYRGEAEHEGGVSLYARTNSGEAFAEVFAMVTHKEFDYTKVSTEARPLVDVMLKILKDKP